jgi:zinc transporter, ZIP family
MIYVSLIEIFAKARASLEVVFRQSQGIMIAFFSEIAIIALIDKFITKGENPHEVRYIKLNFASKMKLEWKRMVN